ncbi:MAG: hypothetical protein SNJ57_09325 [Cyanobacteriota bacterium]
MSEVQVSRLQEIIDQRRRDIVHPSWITGVPIEQISWHLPTIVGNVLTAQPIYVPEAVARDRQNLARLQAKTLGLPLTPAPIDWERSPNCQRGIRFHVARSIDNLMGYYGEESEDHSIDLDVSPDDLRAIAPTLNHKAVRMVDHGYLLDILISNDYNVWGRWLHWQKLYRNGAIDPAESIPWIPFCDQPQYANDIMEFFLDQISPRWRSDPAQRRAVAEYFLRYMLWALGHHAQPNQPIDLWDGGAHDRLSYCLPKYIRRLLLFPAGHFSLMAEDLLGLDMLPQARANTLVKSIFPGRRNDYRASLLVMPEPCGTVALAASNHTYEIHAISTDPWRAIATLLDCYLFAPWVVFPFRWLGETVPESNILDIIARTQQLINGQRVSRHFFRQAEADPDAPDLRPFQIVRRINFELEFEQGTIDLASELTIRLVNNLPMLPFSQAVPLPPETKLWLPTAENLRTIIEQRSPKALPPNPDAAS